MSSESVGHIMSKKLQLMDLHIINKITEKDLKVFEGKDCLHERIWYMGVCSPEEIDRILNVKDASDYLLKLRADIIADNTRLWRVFLALSKKYGDKYITLDEDEFYTNVKKEIVWAMMEIIKSDLRLLGLE